MRSVLDFLVREGALSEAQCNRLRDWRHSGFSMRNQVRIAEGDSEGRK